MSRSPKRQKHNTYGLFMLHDKLMETREINKFLDNPDLITKAIGGIVKKIKNFLIDNGISKKNHDRIFNTVQKIKRLKKPNQYDYYLRILDFMPDNNDKDSKTEDEENIDILNEKIKFWFYKSFFPRELANFFQNNGIKKQDYKYYIESKLKHSLYFDLKNSVILNEIFHKPDKNTCIKCIEDTLNFFKEEEEEEEEEYEEEEEEDEEEEEEVNYMDLPFGSNKKRPRV